MLQVSPVPCHHGLPHARAFAKPGRGNDTLMLCDAVLPLVARRQAESVGPSVDRVALQNLYGCKFSVGTPYCRAASIVGIRPLLKEKAFPDEEQTSRWPPQRTKEERNGI